MKFSDLLLYLLLYIYKFCSFLATNFGRRIYKVKDFNSRNINSELITN